MAGRNSDRKARLKELLLERKRRMWLDLRDEIFRSTGEDLHTQFDIPHDPGEQSLIDLLQDTELSVADIRRQELTQMDEAMGKLERGTFGICEGCGEEIPEERLTVIPFALYCIECQRQREAVPYPPGAKL